MDADHLYSFYTNGDTRTEPAICHPFENNGLPADQTTSGDMNLQDGQFVKY
jgi:hypothetical protein